MPPTRRARTSGGGAATAKGAQSTLSFGAKAKVTKSSVPASSKLGKELTSNLKSETLVPVEPEQKVEVVSETRDEVELDDDLETGHVVPDAAVKKQARVEPGKEKSEVERRAERIGEGEVRRYWLAREAERIAARVHQEDLSVEEKILRLFDMSSQYGPCIGIARIKRWNRAQKLGLSPPIEVLAVLLKEEKKGNRKIERAYVDELMSSKTVVGGS